MKISVNDQELFSLTEIQKQVMCNDITQETLDDDMKRRLQYILMHKYENCFKRLKQEWDVKLIENGVTMVPTDADAYAALVFDQPNYKSRSVREAEAKAAEGRL